ncbi:iron-sulfur cluster repair di-iron protein, ric [Enterococcus dongliensis]|uniref:iron-sulfur cluster repair di-iron protein, ric n=1 Tax=Enterococcus dongliensis TaxID=2559925 RepID=UPI002891865D|nr:iron-sulfur cluster repair di-iron protein, ric [Enterococcus dongliensis]MDT2614055.1 iron-sulfur cluster repair di-iron protein, ric [Enterococcus dongliensis]MDT2638525.1 iron-sulfur cluster repair di-iron protein, ric [Enterococcus dongliensis]
MSKISSYLNENREKLALYTTAITRAHGANHPEVFEVKKIYDTIWDQLQNEGSEVNLDTEFEQLRETTNNYEIPSDVCQTFEATYAMLAEADQLNQK